MMLSVITIAYNNLAGLQKTLAVFGKLKDPTEIEVVVVDGGSQDGSLAYLQAQTITNNWVSESDRGIYHAMNKGLEMAHGKYVWFLNSGDYVERTATIKEILDLLSKNPDALYGETMLVNKDGDYLGGRSDLSTRKLPEMLNWKSFRMGMNVGHQSFIIKREHCKKYDENLKYVADIDWMIDSLKNCKQVINTRKVLACFTMEGFSSVNRNASNFERFKVLQKHYGFFPNLIAHVGILIRKLFALRKV